VTKKPMIMLGVALAIMSWLIETDIHVYVFKQGPFSQWLYPATNTNEIWMRFVISALFLSLGFLAQYVLEYKREEEKKIKESEAKYRILFESSADAIMLLDQKEFFDCNQATLKMFGCTSQEEFLKKHPAELSPPMQPNGESSLKLADQYIATAFAKGSVKFEWIFNRLDGTEFPAETWLTTMELGKQCFLQAIVRDISEHKQAALALIESENKFRTLAESTTVGVFLFRDRFLYANPKCSEMSGYSQEQLLHMGLADLLHPDSLREVQQNWEHRKQGDATPKYCNVQFLTKSGEVRWGQLTTVMIYFEGLPTTVGSVVDITELKRKEASILELSHENRRLAQQLLQIQERERQDLARELHDELGQKLTVIKTLLARAASHQASREKQGEIIQEIDATTDHVIAATRNILQRLRPGMLDSTGLAGTLADLVKTWEKQQGISCTFDSSGDLDDLNDEIQLVLYRIAQESLTNIARHAHAGHVQLYCHRQNAPAGDDDLCDTVTLVISDDGIGISKPAPQQGLGLAGIRERAQALRGSMEIKSGPNQGTRIVISLPLKKNAP